MPNPDQGAILSAVDDYANAVAANATADQKAADDTALAALQADFDAYKASHPDPGPDPQPDPGPQPKPPAGTCVFGSSLGKALPAAQTLGAFRFYSPSSSWGSAPAQEYAKGTRVFVISTKDATPDGLVGFCKTAPKDALLYVTAYHEPDDNIADGSLKQATWAAKMNTFGKALAGLPNVHFGPIHNGSYGKAVWTADEAGCDTSLWSYWGMDRYCPNYQDPADQFAEGRDFAASLGLPLVIAETGASPTNPAAQKTLAAQVRAWALDPANNCAVVTWWNQGDRNFANADVQHTFLG